jgi:hypothetical protein
VKYPDDDKGEWVDGEKRIVDFATLPSRPIMDIVLPPNICDAFDELFKFTAEGFEAALFDEGVLPRDLCKRLRCNGKTYRAVYESFLPQHRFGHTATLDAGYKNFMVNGFPTIESKEWGDDFTLYAIQGDGKIIGAVTNYKGAVHD